MILDRETAPLSCNEHKQIVSININKKTHVLGENWLREIWRAERSPLRE
jgi:hypothetical protein